MKSLIDKVKDYPRFSIDEVEKFPSINSNLIIASNKSIHEDLKKLELSNIETSLKKRL